ncbi:hypothetical protein LGH82_13055 [Mesorhizobium sp. PAMC28654]|uniref:hypothetical protein n=1 Tax=Mesorhizobium sp. PAMC28654 TaxID=2880934 RepID=UPI001D0B8E8F|nr:hypothetical protein [Mesorhizobium sp. PAMC28654]UDL92071.1 hypothetical protein LGH82_13055 [Mesorhizobium sp. PAMC28654]
MSIQSNLWPSVHNTLVFESAALCGDDRIGRRRSGCWQVARQFGKRKIEEAITGSAARHRLLSLLQLRQHPEYGRADQHQEEHGESMIPDAQACGRNWPLDEESGAKYEQH